MRPLIIFLLVVVLLVVGVKSLRSTKTPDAAVQTQMSSVQKQDCVSEDMHGTLVATVDTQGKATGWTCTFVAGYFACTAKGDGAWTNCTFDPALHPWPDNVSAEALAHPDLYVSGSTLR